MPYTDDQIKACFAQAKTEKEKEGCKKMVKSKEGHKESFENKLNKILSEKSKSKAQQSAAAIALQVKQGEKPESALQGASKQMYDNMTEKELEDFAKTQRSGLPDKLDESYLRQCEERMPFKESSRRIAESRYDEARWDRLLPAGEDIKLGNNEFYVEYTIGVAAEPEGGFEWDIIDIDKIEAYDKQGNNTVPLHPDKFPHYYTYKYAIEDLLKQQDDESIRDHIEFALRGY